MSQKTAPSLWTGDFTISALPSLIVPALSGPFPDRFSRKKTIYTLDFLSAGLFLLMAGIFALDGFSFPLLAAVLVIGGNRRQVAAIYNVE